jgi:hypothetical protein
MGEKKNCETIVGIHLPKCTCSDVLITQVRWAVGTNDLLSGQEPNATDPLPAENIPPDISIRYICRHASSLAMWVEGGVWAAGGKGLSHCCTLTEATERGKEGGKGPKMLECHLKLTSTTSAVIWPWVPSLTNVGVPGGTTDSGH